MFMYSQSVHDEIKRKNKIFAVCVSVIIILFTVARMILTRFYIDPYIHFYTDNAPVSGVYFDYAVAASIVAIYAVSFFIYKRKRENHYYSEVTDCFVQGTQSQVFSACLPGFLFATSAGFQIYSFMSPELSSIPGGVPLIERLVEYIKLYPFDFIIFFFSILSAAYYFKTAMLDFDIGENVAQPEKPEPAEEHGVKNNIVYKYSPAHIIFSFMPIIWAFLNAFQRFFDMSKSVNSPVRIYELMSFLALSAYFVSESRMLVGRLQTSRFFTFAYIASIITAVSALPNLIWASFWILEPNSNFTVYAVQLALVIYMMSRVYSQIRYSRFSLQR